MNKKILVVEDEEHILKLVTFLLEKENYSVIQARNGKEAVFKAKAEYPNLILLDIMIPKMNGFEVVEKIREDFALKQVPVIILSSKSQFEDKIKAVDLGVVDYVTKPFDNKLLIAKIKEYIK